MHPAPTPSVAGGEDALGRPDPGGVAEFSGRVAAKAEIRLIGPAQATRGRGLETKDHAAAARRGMGHADRRASHESGDLKTRIQTQHLADAEVVAVGDFGEAVAELDPRGLLGFGGSGERRCAAQFTGVDRCELLGLLAALAGKDEPIATAEGMVFVDVVELGELALVLSEFLGQLFNADGAAHLHPKAIGGGQCGEEMLSGGWC